MDVIENLLLLTKTETNGTFSEVCSEPYQTSKIEFFAKIVIRSNVFAKNSLKKFENIKYGSDLITA